MLTYLCAILIVFACANPTLIGAQTCPSTSISTGNETQCPCPDVFLDVPELSVDLISLVVEDLAAHVSLSANVANLVTLNAGW
jgi:hypothetical protein